ncbi:MAG: hypothetical protein ABIJ61_02435 [bacterium]
MLELLVGIPQPDTLPIPSPAWLLKFFLLLTFLLHIIAMNILLGGVLLGFVSYLRREVEYHRLLAKELWHVMPPAVAATVTLGVAPLLFVQVLYGHLLYSSSIIMGWWWWLVIPLLIVAYFTTYKISMRDADGVGWRPLLVLLLLIVVSLIYSNNMSLMLTPEKFAPMQLETQSGWSLNLGEASLIPRWLHMVLGAVAVAALVVAWLGKRRLDSKPEFGKWAVGYGGKIFGAITHLQIVVGLVFIMTLRREVMLMFMGHNLLATILLPVSLILAVYLGIAGFRLGKKPKSLNVVMLLTGLILVIMVVMRDLVRDAYLFTSFDYRALAVGSDWSPFIVFALVFLAGLVTLFWMLRKYFKR